MHNFNDFPTQFRFPEHFYSDPGSRTKVKYSPKYDSEGRLSLEAVGEIDLYDEIQSHAESVDINVLLKRFSAGDSSVLQQRVNGVYGDFSDFPKTYADVLNAVVKGEETFNSLPVEIRAKFNHSSSEFLSSVGTPEFFEALGVKSPVGDSFVDPVVEPDAVKEVKSNES